MNLSTTIDFARSEYKKLKPTFCPYIQDVVHFNAKGFNHLIWKSTQSMRTRAVIQERAEALSVIEDILSKSGTLQEYENKTREYLCFIAIIQNKKYKVVVAKKKDGTYSFVSVIPKWKTSQRDKDLNNKK